MNAGLKGVKKFKFFEQEKSEKFDEKEKSLNYNLSDMIPVTFRIHEKYYYVSGKLKEDKNFHPQKPFIIAKMHPSEKIIEEYFPFTDCIIDFDFVKFENTTYLVAIGTDFKNKEVKSTAKAEIQGNKQSNKIIVTPSPQSIPSVKIFSLTDPQDESEEKNKVKEFGNLKLEYVYYLMFHKGKFTDLYKGDNINDITEAYNPINDISFFSFSPFMNAFSFSFKNCLMEIKISPIIKKAKDKKFSIIDKIFLVSTPDKKDITNIKYCINNNETFLYFTTNENIYYKKYTETKLSFVGNELIHSGVNPKNFDIKSNRNILISTPEYHYIEEYSYDNANKNYEKIGTKVFDKPCKFIQYFGLYYLFALYEDNKPTLCVYDPINNIFVTFDDFFKQKDKDILSIISTDDRIYILSTSSNIKNINCFKECEDKKKFDIFYKNEFFDLAYNYAKSLNYDREQLSEIAKAYAEFYYNKDDFQKSVDQYKLTINYIDPTYVIQKFMDDSKKNYLIQYLEELQKNEEFKKKYESNPKRFKDLTTLLFNCYIKQKQIDKLKDFFKNNNVKDENTIKSAIDLCKEINNVELLLSFSEMVKIAKMHDLYIQILIDIPSDYKHYLQYVKKIPPYIHLIDDFVKKYKVLINHGKKLLENKDISDDIHKVIMQFIDMIINTKKKYPNLDGLNTIKYMKIISLYDPDECEDKLEKLFTKIMSEDTDCPGEIITKNVELYLDYYNKKEAKEKNSGKLYVTKIRDILMTFKKKIDKNYLLMLFKISGFNEGIAEMGKIMELDQDLLEIYFDQKDFQKINEACKKSMKSQNVQDKKVNFWLRALYFYLDISNKSNINKLNEYIVEVLDNLAKQEEFSPMNLLDILEKVVNDQNKLIEIRTIRKFFKDWIKTKLESLKVDQRETEENLKKIEDYDKSVRDIQMSAKTFNPKGKCASCKNTLDMPYTFFICGHGYHSSCLYDIDNNLECPVCKTKNAEIFQKIENGKNLASKPNKYKEELNMENKGDKFDVFADFLGRGVFIQPENSK